MVFMVEEIADSMTSAGMFAAVVGLCAALTLVVLRARERRRDESEDMLHAPEAKVAAAPSEPAGNAVVPASVPKSAFKTFMPSSGTNVSQVETSSSFESADAAK